MAKRGFENVLECDKCQMRTPFTRYVRLLSNCPACGKGKLKMRAIPKKQPVRQLEMFKA